MKTLVLGAAGEAGTQLLEALAADGRRIVMLGAGTPAQLERLFGAHRFSAVIRMDERAEDPQALRDAMARHGVRHLIRAATPQSACAQLGALEAEHARETELPRAARVAGFESCIPRTRTQASRFAMPKSFSLSI